MENTNKQWPSNTQPTSNDIMSMWQQLQNMQTEMNSLRRENQGLQATITSITSRANTPAPSLPPAPLGPVQPKKKLPDPAKFSGAKAEFPNWRETVRSKLAVDGAYIGTLDVQTHYVLTLLKVTPHSGQARGGKTIKGRRSSLPKDYSSTLLRVSKIVSLSRRPCARFGPLLKAIGRLRSSSWNSNRT